MITPQEALQRTIEHREIFHDEMLHLMRLIMNGEVSPVMTAAILAGLRTKKETIGEIAAAATVMRELCTKVEVPNNRNFVDHRRHRRRCRPYLQHLHRRRLRRRRGRRHRGQARRPQRLVEVGQRRRVRGAGREDRPQRRAGGGVHRGGRHGLHVRAQPPPGDEERRAGAQGNGRAHHFQHPRPAHQPGRRAQHPDGRVPPRPRRHPGARDAASRRRPRAGGLRQGRPRRDLARRGDAGRRTQGRRRSANTKSTPRTSACRWFPIAASASPTPPSR